MPSNADFLKATRMKYTNKYYSKVYSETVNLEHEQIYLNDATFNFEKVWNSLNKIGI